MNEHEIKEYLADCLIGLEQAGEALQDIIEDDCESRNWYEQIEILHEKILFRYERR